MREVTLLLHFIGLGLMVTTSVGGILLQRQYGKAPDLKTKAVILKSARPFGLLGPIASLLMLVTGIGNMHALGLGILDLGWLSAKLAIFAVAVVAGTFLGVIAGKRGKLVQAAATGGGGAETERRIASFDTILTAGHYVMPILLIAILYLSTIGRLGAQ